MTPTKHPPSTTQRRLSKIQLCFILFLVTMAIIWLIVDIKIKCTVITVEPVVVSVFLNNFPNHPNIPSSEKPDVLHNSNFKNLSIKTVQETIRHRERQHRSAIFRKTLERSRKAWKDRKKRERFRFRRLTPGRINAFKNVSIQKHKEVIADEMANEFPNVTSTFAGGGKPIRNLILTTWRSGSTFVGSVVDSHPGTFYDYEPFLYLGEHQAQPGPEEDEALQIINQIFSCDYVAVAQTRREYMLHLNFKIMHHTGLQRYCHKSTVACRDPNFLTEICKLSPYLAVKTVRLRVRMGGKLLNKTDNLRLLLLIRDPRGIMRSRMQQGWCRLKHRDCSSVENLCGYMEDDLEHAKILRNKYPDRFLAIRYEDVVLKPGPAFQKIFQFFRLRMTNKVKSFIELKVNTYRSAESFAFKWKKEFAKEGFKNVISIQNNCSKVMDWWGYRMVMEEKELMKTDPLLNPPWPEMIIQPDNSFVVVDGLFRRKYLIFPRSMEITKGNVNVSVVG